MNRTRKEYKDKITLQINTLQKCIETDDNMLDNLKDQGETPFVMAQISRVETKNASRQSEIDLLTQRIIDIDSGIVDDEITQDLEDIKLHQETMKKTTMQRRLDKIEMKKANSDISQGYHKKTIQGDREKRWLDKDMKRSYEHFWRANDSIPDHMLESLRQMPNNKGYIWKGVMCMGNKPEEKNNPPLTMFERQKGGLLIIHEWSTRDYKVFHKKGKDRKILASSAPRRIIPEHMESIFEKI